MMAVSGSPAPVAPVPRSLRSRVSLGFTAAAAVGQFELQVCTQCETVQYPPREACHRCLSDSLVWKPQSGAGELLSSTVLHHTHDPYFRQRLPWSVGMVRLDSGPTVLVHLPASVPAPPVRVWVSARLDRGGMGVLVASERQDGADLSNDRRLQEMTSDPRDANVLVTDGGSAHSQAIVRALAAAGAARIWVGLAKPAEPVGMREVPQVTCLRLDVTDKGSVREAASQVGSEIDILINTEAVQGDSDIARSEMETQYFGLLNLATWFVPSMILRAARTQQLCPAWVNVLSIFALSSAAPWTTYGASMAAAQSLLQSLRAQLQEAGARLVTVFPEPLEDEGLQQPKLAAPALATSIVAGLRAGVEEIWLQGMLDQRGVRAPPR